MKRTILLMVLALFCTFFKINVHGMTAQTHKTISVDNGCIYAIKTDGCLYRYEKKDGEVDKYNKTKILENVIDVSRNYAILEDHTLWTWDNASYKVSKVMDSVTDISAGGLDNDCLILKDDGSLWEIPLNYGGYFYSVLSKHDNQTYYFNAPRKITDNVLKAERGAYHSVILKKDGNVWALGDNSYGQCGSDNGIYGFYEPVQMFEGAENIFAGGAVTFIKKADGIIYICGSNYVEHLGDSPSEATPTEYASGIRYALNIPGYNLMIKNDDSLWLYGDTKNPEILFSDGTDKVRVPVKIFDDIDSIDGIDNVDDRFYLMTLVLKKNGELSFMQHTKGLIFVMNTITRNIRLTGDVVINNQFTDINDLPEPMKQAIARLYKGGIVQGVSDGLFEPNKAVDRAEIAALMLRMTGKANESGNNIYTDVTPDKWYYNAVGACQTYGIIEGYEDNTFRGEEAVSDIQLTVLAARALRNEGTAVEPDEVKSFTFDNIPKWAKDDVKYAYDHELVTEEEIKALSGRPMTRGEAAVILYRLYNEI